MIECRNKSHTNAGLNPIFNKTSNNIHNQAKKKKKKGQIQKLQCHHFRAHINNLIYCKMELKELKLLCMIIFSQYGLSSVLICWCNNRDHAALFNITHLFFCFSDYNTKFPSGGEDRTRPLWNGKGNVANLEPPEEKNISRLCSYFASLKCEYIEDLSWLSWTWHSFGWSDRTVMS